VLVAQITDCHIVEPGGFVADRIDPAPALERALSTLAAAPIRPDLVVGTGDLVNDGRPSQYDRLQELLADLDVPFVPVPGNHDDRSELRRRFADVLPEGGPDDPIDHVIDLGPLRLVLLDTQIPGTTAGRLTSAQLAWLHERLAEAADRPVVVFQHHPPFTTGIGFMDRDRFEGGAEYAEVLARHGHVELVSCGHLHRTIVRRFGGTVAATWPATSVALDLGLGDTPVHYTDEPTGVVLHHWDRDAGLRSHVLAAGDHERWIPAWALGRM
jgi:Icc protein